MENSDPPEFSTALTTAATVTATGTIVIIPSK